MIPFYLSRSGEVENRLLWSCSNILLFFPRQNSDDNHGIQGLLAILRAQQDEEYSPHRHEIPNQHQQQSRNPSAYQNPYGSSQSSSTKDPRAAHRAVSRTLSNSQSTSQDQDLELEEQNGPSKKKISTEELHSMSFAKALPILTKLAGDEVFLKEVMKVSLFFFGNESLPFCSLKTSEVSSRESALFSSLVFASHHLDLFPKAQRTTGWSRKRSTERKKEDYR